MSPTFIFCLRLISRCASDGSYLMRIFNNLLLAVFILGQIRMLPLYFGRKSSDEQILGQSSFFLLVFAASQPVMIQGHKADRRATETAIPIVVFTGHLQNVFLIKCRQQEQEGSNLELIGQLQICILSDFSP